MSSRSVMDTPAFPVKHKYLDVSSMGSTELVAAISGRQINVISLAVVSKLANDIKFLSAATQISATMPLGNNGGYVLPHNLYGWFNTEVGEALNINLSAATATGVMITYIED